MHLHLAPGSAISEKDIAESLEVSRTPVREAFIKLAQENYLDIIPQKGSYVSLIDPEHVDEVRFCRESVEKEVMKLACHSFPKEDLFKLQSNLALQSLCMQEKNYVRFFELDAEMHGIIFAGCNKARIWTMIQQMNTHYDRVRMLSLVFGFDLDRLLIEHQQIFNSIREGNLEAGLQVLSKHLNKLTVDIKQLQSEFGHFFKQPPKLYSVGSQQ